MRQYSLDEVSNHEVLLTNGLGGYSFASVYGANARKYHGIYTVSFNPPVERYHLVSSLGASVLVNGVKKPLSEENIKGNDVTASALKEMHQMGSLIQVYEVDGVRVQREIAFKPYTNQLAVTFEVISDLKAAIVLEPSVNFRDHHETIPVTAGDYRIEITSDQRGVSVSAYDKTVYVQSSHDFEKELAVTETFYYPVETERGYPDEENHLKIGRIESQSGDKLTLIFNTQAEFDSAENIMNAAIAHSQDLLDQTGFKEKAINQLVLASDQFIVNRASTGLKTIIAGYPWFTDWGRDTMIALTGLTLTTKRYDQAFEMIEGFIRYMHKGIIPNNFPDEGQAPMYNTSDGTLWLYNALYEYYERTKDLEGVKRLYPALLDSINHHMKGTINDIYMDTDGLLSTGNETTQLTWMDVKVNGWVVTPRHGKAVEINALWYNALAIVSYFGDLIGLDNLASQEEKTILKAAQTVLPQVKSSFNQAFVNQAGHNLYDLIIEGEAIDIPRPNMLFAISLPFPVLEQDHWQMVVETVKKDFKTPYGIRTLQTHDANYHGIYTGDLLSRDGAYHRGTVWGWLMGPYLEAHYKTYQDKAYILQALEDFYPHLEEGILGSASEVFDADPPYHQKGCSAQAWSVAEIIRIYEMIHRKN